MSKQEHPEVAAFALNPVLRRHKVSKRRLSKLTGIPYAMLCRLARDGANPTWQTLLRLAAAIGCDLNEFAARKGGKWQSEK
jgi:hypothetical protein